MGGWWRRVLAGTTPFLAFLMPPCEPVTRFGLDACNQYLPGSQVLADIDADQVPIVCEQRTDHTPAKVIGWWDGTTIHIYDPPPELAHTYTGKYVLDIAAHEYGHVIGDRHPEWERQWADVRHSSNASEDFAAGWAYCIYPRDDGAGYIFYADHSPTDAECAAMQYWYPLR